MMELLAHTVQPDDLGRVYVMIAGGHLLRMPARITGADIGRQVRLYRRPGQAVEMILEPPHVRDAREIVAGTHTNMGHVRRMMSGVLPNPQARTS